MRDLRDSPFERILFVKLTSLGDVVHALPSASALRTRFPEARITWLVDQRFAAIVRGHPAVDECLAVAAPRWTGRAPFESVVRASFQYGVIPRLRRQRFDLAVDVQGLFRSAALAAGSGARFRLGPRDAREGAPLFYTHRGGEPASPHAVDRNLAVLSPLGVAARRPRFDLEPTEEASKAADKLLERAGLPPDAPFVAVGPKTSRPEKDWPAERYAEAIGRIERDHGLLCVLLGGSADATVCRAIADRSGSRAAALTGQPLDVSMAILAKCALFLGNDSGPLHLAAALGRPIVAVYGPTDPERTGPYGQFDRVVRRTEGCPVCRRLAARWPDAIARLGTKGHRCLVSLPTADVVERIDRVLAEARR